MPCSKVIEENFRLQKQVFDLEKEVRLLQVKEIDIATYTLQRFGTRHHQIMGHIGKFTFNDCSHPTCISLREAINALLSLAT